MNHSNYWISLDINKIQSQLTLTLKQGETGRNIHINLTEDGRPYQIGEGCYAWLQAKKNNSINPMSHPCTIENNKIVYCVQPDTTSTVGRVECEIVLSSSDGQIIISASFSINVYNTIFTEIEEDNKTEIGTLSSLIVEANSLIDDVESKLDKGEFNAGFAEEMNVTVKTGDAGSEASVLVTANSETPNTAKQFNFDFTIPKGEQGIQGIQGEKGGTGAKLISQVLQGQDENGGNIYLQTFDDGTTATFTAPRGMQGIQGEKGEKGDGGSVDLTDYVKNTDYATDKKAGVARFSNGLYVNPASGLASINPASNGDIDRKIAAFLPITPVHLDYAVKVGVTTNTLTLNETEKTAAQNWLGITSGTQLYLHTFGNPDDPEMEKFKIISTSRVMNYRIITQDEDVGDGETYYGEDHRYLEVSGHIIKAEYWCGDEYYPEMLTIEQGFVYNGEDFTYKDIDGNFLWHEGILTIGAIGNKVVSSLLGDTPQQSIGIEL